MIKELLYYFEGLDESILKLNPYLIDSGFEFVPYDLDEFEEKFRGLFPLCVDYFDDEANILDLLTFRLPNSRYFNQWEILQNKQIVFLRDIFINKDLDIETKTDEKNPADGDAQQLSQSRKRLTELIKRLKLFKSGHVKLLSSFLFSDDVSLFPYSYLPASQRPTYEKYSLNDTDLSELKYFKGKFEIPSYLDLAFNSFLESYNIEDEKLKFIVLMISLESIFNIDLTPIKHTVSSPKNSTF